MSSDVTSSPPFFLRIYIYRPYTPPPPLCSTVLVPPTSFYSRDNVSEYIVGKRDTLLRAHVCVCVRARLTAAPLNRIPPHAVTIRGRLGSSSKPRFRYYLYRPPRSARRQCVVRVPVGVVRSSSRIIRRLAARATSSSSS